MIAPTAVMPSTVTAATTDWRQSVPVLTGGLVTLRELEISDAASLFEMLTTQEVARFISPPPTTVEAFERFITWARRERGNGDNVCFAVVPHGLTKAVGLFQIRKLDAAFSTAEWGFALGSPFWGTGTFMDGAELAVAFAFTTLGVSRLEARAAILNGRGNGALRKIGAVQEAVLRRSFLCQGQYLDQVLWSILEPDWRLAKAVSASSVRVH